MTEEKSHVSTTTSPAATSLKATLLSLGATLFAACGRALGIPATLSPTLTPTSTSVNKR